jgi:hypothetical protein
MDFFQKPRTFRDRKKNPSKKQVQESTQHEELHHPQRQPYRREKNWKVEEGYDDE